ncbi:RadC family protein [Burkholderia singularis]|uniref:DNA repair protein RadC n=1 Tax=Burkholderia singularis TaxID=1503053 RepID=A0A238GYY1_9BURK|nr:DNA repair protein RadC [Burkholderia singularis]SMF98143.1 DNA repair protein RadC [Burkholderia singularis]
MQHDLLMIGEDTDEPPQEWRAAAVPPAAAALTACRAATPTAAPMSARRGGDLPRERLLERGPAALSDAELIALLLGTGLPGHDVFALANTLLMRFGSLRALLDAAPGDFKGLRGIGNARAAMLVAVVELARRALAEKARERPLVDSPGALEDYLRLMIGTQPHEVFVCLFLDARHRVLRTEESARGSLTRMAVYPREIVRRALALNAAALIVAHNHPSGAVQPSAADRRLTHVLRDALALVDVRLSDHLVIGANDTFSFARAGWL